jgi:micrococcal nuclease
MNKSVQYLKLTGLGALLWALLLVPALAGPGPETRVDFVPDGDTLVLADGRIVRLQGIDAPETAHDQQPGQYFGQRSRRALQAYARQQIAIEPADQRLDRYGRTLALVYLPDGELVNELMVLQGRAFYYPHFGQDRELQDRLLRAQRKAMQAGRGFWPRILDLPQAAEPYLGNTNSHRFHRLDCPFGQQTAKHNRQRFSSLYAAFYAGFAPCRRCSPWPVTN